MKSTVTINDFIQAFKTMDRKENFSYDGLVSLFEYLEEMEESCETEIELDVIALCCEYTEYENIKEFWKDYDKEDYPDLETLRDNTTVIEIEGTDGFIIQAF